MKKYKTPPNKVSKEADKLYRRCDSILKDTKDMADQLYSMQKSIKSGKKNLQNDIDRLNSTYQKSNDKFEKLQNEASHIIGKIKKRHLDRSIGRDGDLGLVGKTFAFFLILLGIFFLQVNITGNAIANLSPKISLGAGGILFIAGIVIGFFSIKKKN